jgi:hypothetical protein
VVLCCEDNIFDNCIMILETRAALASLL